MRINSIFKAEPSFGPFFTAHVEDLIEMKQQTS